MVMWTVACIILYTYCKCHCDILDMKWKKDVPRHVQLLLWIWWKDEIELKDQFYIYTLRLIAKWLVYIKSGYQLLLTKAYMTDMSCLIVLVLSSIVKKLKIPNLNGWPNQPTAWFWLDKTKTRLLSQQITRSVILLELERWIFGCQCSTDVLHTIYIV